VLRWATEAAAAIVLSAEEVTAITDLTREEPG
jgi:hypothetical protein